MSEEPNEKPTEAKPASAPGLKDGRLTPTYLVLQRVTLTTDRQEYEPGQIVDLSHLPQESIRYYLSAGIFATADGEPANTPANVPQPCKNC